MSKDESLWGETCTLCRGERVKGVIWAGMKGLKVGDRRMCRRDKRVTGERHTPGRHYDQSIAKPKRSHVIPTCML